MQLHGGVRDDEARAYGLAPGSILDFSASVNPFGPSPRVWQALRTLDLARYPDPDCLALTEEIARRHAVAPDCVLVGNGATELIHLIVRVFVHGGQRAVAFTPTFGEFERACVLEGASLYPWRANPDRGFQWTLRNKADVLRRVTPPLVYLCNPNNPTGVYLGQHDVESLSAGLLGGPLLLDEAYVNFVDEPWQATPLTRSGRVIQLRSMTKDYALAGLRLGYAIAHPDAVAAVKRLQPEWSVSAAAQVAGLAALGDTDHLQTSLVRIRQAKAGLLSDLSELGFSVHGGSANFLLIRTGDGAATRMALFADGIAVRDCTSFGMPEYIRVAVRTPEENARLVAALARHRQSVAQEASE